VRDQPGPGSEYGSDPGSGDAGAPLTVLVVEDELLIGMDLVMLLEEWGYATSGPHRTPEAAIRAVRTDHPDLAILDVNLGGGQTSLTVAQALHDAGKPFLFLSGYSPGRYADEALIARTTCLQKPVSERALRGALAERAATIG